MSNGPRFYFAPGKGWTGASGHRAHDYPELYCRAVDIVLRSINLVQVTVNILMVSQVHTVVLFALWRM